MLTLWGRRNSMNVQKVTWALNELGLDYERLNVGGGFGGNADPDYLARNPNGVVPTLEDDGLVLWESNAIVRYLARRYGSGSLLPADEATAAIADQWMEWTTSTFSQAIFQVFSNRIRLPPEKANPAAEQRGIEQCATLLARVDARLRDQDYLAGGEFSMADIPLGAAMYRYFTMRIDRPALPGVEAWYHRLAERPAYKVHVMIPFGTNVTEWDELEAAGADQP